MNGPSSHPLSLTPNPDLIRPLGQAQNEFVQVLLSHFELSRTNQGLLLEVNFDYSTPSIWLRRGKAYVRGLLDRSRVHEYRSSLREMLLGETRPGYSHDDPAFPFRFGSGGALPVVHLDGDDYYCLFYRGVHPVGWNIANGGAESTAELLDPTANMERELREELIIVDLEEGNRYVFDWAEGRRVDHPEFAMARDLWQMRFDQRGFSELRELALPLKWLSGQDRMLMHFEGKPVEVRDCFLNINAEDFGIEIDRVAKVSVGPKAVFCDGEVVRGSLLDRPVGLFRVHRFNAMLAAESPNFSPDRLFWNGREFPKEDFDRVIEASLEDQKERHIFAFDTRAEYDAAEFKYALCPVTDILVRRSLRMETDKPPVPPPQIESGDIFLSFNSECRDLAKQVFDCLKGHGRRVFFSDETIHQVDFGRAIDDALEAATALVVVGREADHFRKGWVEFEWRTFHQDILGNRKPTNTPLVTVTQETDTYRLPRPLAHRQVLRWDESCLSATKSKLYELLKVGSPAASTYPAGPRALS